MKEMTIRALWDNFKVISARRVRGKWYLRSNPFTEK